MYKKWWLFYTDLFWIKNERYVINLIFNLFFFFVKLIISLFAEKKVKPSQAKKPIDTEISKINAAQTSKQQKIRSIQQAIANSQSNNSNQNIDNQCLSLVFKIAHELLESVKEPRQPTDGAYRQEFCSPSAELYLKENGKKLGLDDHLHETPRDLEEKKLQFNFLNGNNGANYKKMLEYLSNTIGFKVIYQSLLGVILNFRIWNSRHFFLFKFICKRGTAVLILMWACQSCPTQTNHWMATASLILSHQTRPRCVPCNIWHLNIVLNPLIEYQVILKIIN